MGEKKTPPPALTLFAMDTSGAGEMNGSLTE